MTFDEGDQQPDQKVQDPFALHQQRLRQAMENSAALLVQSLRKIDAQFEPGIPAYSQPNAIHEANPMGPITAEFVSTAYQRARQTFDELERKMNETQSNWSSPLNRPLVPEGQTDTAVEDAHAATDRMMSIAKSHLSEAMKAMVEAMDHRPGVTTQKRNHEHTL
jgi:hypothetical protein